MKNIQYMGDGSRINVYKYDTDRFKSENISVYFALPNVKKSSVARSLLLSVLKRGTEKYPSQKLINEKLDENYATLLNLKNQKFEGVQLLGVTADFIYSQYTDNGEDILPSALDVIEQIFLHPKLEEKTHKFCKEFLDSEKENYKSIILSQINEPRTYAAIRCREEMFDSLGIIDKLDTMCEKIDSTTVDDIWNCYLELVKSASVFVFYVGSRSIEAVKNSVDSVFADRECKALECEAHEPRLLPPCDEPKVIIESSDISQGRLVMGFNSGVTWRDEDYYAMLLLNEIFGASPISKLMMNVREELSLCYECSSVYNSARGVIFATTGIDSENYELAKGAIINQMETIKNCNISETEFISAKRSLFNAYSALADSPSAIERFYLGRIINHIDVDIEEFISKLDALKIDDVVRVAKRISLHTVYFLRGNGEGNDNE